MDAKISKKDIKDIFLQLAIYLPEEVTGKKEFNTFVHSIVIDENNEMEYRGIISEHRGEKIVSIEAGDVHVETLVVKKSIEEKGLPQKVREFIRNRYTQIEEKDVDNHWKQYPEKLLELIELRNDPPINNNIRTETKKALSDFNDNPLRFLSELIQNADDCKYDGNSKGLSIVFKKEEGKDKENSEYGVIELSYPEEGFTFADIVALSDFNDSNKRQDWRKIGEKGRGFKSLYTYFSRVDIHSREYDFYYDTKDKGFLVPVYLKPEKEEGTRLKLYLKNDEDNNFSIEKLWLSIKKSYGSDNILKLYRRNPVLFTRNINELTLINEIEDETIVIKNDCYLINEYENRVTKESDAWWIGDGNDFSCCKADIELKINEQEKQTLSLIGMVKYIDYSDELIKERYSEFSEINNEEIKKEQPMIMFGVSPKDMKGTKDPVQGHMYTYLPTSVDMNMPFIFQMPFNLEDNRSCPKVGDEWNKNLMNELLKGEKSLISEWFDKYKEKLHCNCCNELSYLPYGEKNREIVLHMSTDEGQNERFLEASNGSIDKFNESFGECFKNCFNEIMLFPCWKDYNRSIGDSCFASMKELRILDNVIGLFDIEYKEYDKTRYYNPYLWNFDEGNKKRYKKEYGSIKDVPERLKNFAEKTGNNNFYVKWQDENIIPVKEPKLYYGSERFYDCFKEVYFGEGFIKAVIKSQFGNEKLKDIIESRTKNEKLKDILKKGAYNLLELEVNIDGREETRTYSETGVWLWSEDERCPISCDKNVYIYKDDKSVDVVRCIMDRFISYSNVFERIIEKEGQNLCFNVGKRDWNFNILVKYFENVCRYSKDVDNGKNIIIEKIKQSSTKSFAIPCNYRTVYNNGRSFNNHYGYKPDKKRHPELVCMLYEAWNGIEEKGDFAIDYRDISGPLLAFMNKDWKAQHRIEIKGDISINSYKSDGTREYATEIKDGFEKLKGYKLFLVSPSEVDYIDEEGYIVFNIIPEEADKERNIIIVDEGKKEIALGKANASLQEYNEENLIHHIKDCIDSDDPSGEWEKKNELNKPKKIEEKFKNKQETLDLIRVIRTKELLTELIAGREEIENNKVGNGEVLNELLQNIDDYIERSDGKVEITVEENCVIFKYQEKGFSPKDIAAVAGVRKSPKSPNNTMIGKKGIGFKTVYRYFEKIEIHSNGYHFCLDISKQLSRLKPECLKVNREKISTKNSYKENDKVLKELVGNNVGRHHYPIPEWVEGDEKSDGETTLKLFGNKERIEEFKKQLKNINEKKLFLKNIKKVTMKGENPNKEASYLDYSVEFFMDWKISEDSNEKMSATVKFFKDFNSDKAGLLYVGLPTKQETGGRLHIDIRGIELDDARERLVNANDINKKILKKIFGIDDSGKGLFADIYHKFLGDYKISFTNAWRYVPFDLINKYTDISRYENDPLLELRFISGRLKKGKEESAKLYSVKELIDSDNTIYYLEDEDEEFEDYVKGFLKTREDYIFLNGKACEEYPDYIKKQIVNVGGLHILNRNQFKPRYFKEGDKWYLLPEDFFETDTPYKYKAGVSENLREVFGDESKLRSESELSDGLSFESIVDRCNCKDFKCEGKLRPYMEVLQYWGNVCNKECFAYVEIEQLKNLSKEDLDWLYKKEMMVKSVMENKPGIVIEGVPESDNIVDSYATDFDILKKSLKDSEMKKLRNGLGLSSPEDDVIDKLKSRIYIKATSFLRNQCIPFYNDDDERKYLLFIGTNSGSSLKNALSNLMKLFDITLDRTYIPLDPDGWVCPNDIMQTLEYGTQEDYDAVYKMLFGGGKKFEEFREGLEKLLFYQYVLTDGRTLKGYGKYCPIMKMRSLIEKDNEYTPGLSKANALGIFHYPLLGMGIRLPVWGSFLAEQILIDYARDNIVCLKSDKDNKKTFLKVQDQTYIEYDEQRIAVWKKVFSRDTQEQIVRKLLEYLKDVDYNIEIEINMKQFYKNYADVEATKGRDWDYKGKTEKLALELTAVHRALICKLLEERNA